MPYENGRRVSQETFAHKLGVHWVTVSSWERGKAKPGLKNLMAISAVTGKPLSYFAGDEDDEEDDQVSVRRGLALLDDLTAALQFVRGAALSEGEQPAQSPAMGSTHTAAESPSESAKEIPA